MVTVAVSNWATSAAIDSLAARCAYSKTKPMIPSMTATFTRIIRYRLFAVCISSLFRIEHSVNQLLGSRIGILVQRVKQALPAKHALGGVVCLRHAVGVDEHAVTGMELELSVLVPCHVHSTNKQVMTIFEELELTASALESRVLMPCVADALFGVREASLITVFFAVANPPTSFGQAFEMLPASIGSDAGKRRKQRRAVIPPDAYAPDTILLTYSCCKANTWAMSPAKPGGRLW